MTNEITLDPKSPSAGSNVTIGYTGTTPHTLRYRFKIDGVWGAWTYLDAPASVSIPSNATQMQVEDPSGGAPYRDVPV